LPFLRYRRLTSTSTGYWTYLGNEVSLLIVLPTLSTASPIQVQVEFPIATTTATTAAALEGMKGAFFHAMLAKQHLDQAGSTPGTHTTAGGYLDLTASSGDALSFLAGHNLTAFMKRVDSFSTLYQRTIDEVAALHAYTNGTLLQLYSQDSQDSLLCTSTTCIRDDHPLKYFQIRIEGFFPSTVSGPGLLPLNTYYNEALQDHLVTTASAQAVPEGYLPSKLPPAYVFSSAPEPQALPLSLWYHPLRQDHLTVASPAGVDFAKYWGYQLVNASLGFVLAQASSTSTREYVPPDRQSYAMSLLTSVFVSQP
ncbi:MAG: hypothetical protein K2Q09_04495, partial [Phycisphaerales bacterium]|nr:hypothetical protein [Phycisphaerales bacterium]